MLRAVDNSDCFQLPPSSWECGGHPDVMSSPPLPLRHLARQRRILLSSNISITTKLAGNYTHLFTNYFLISWPPVWSGGAAAYGGIFLPSSSLVSPQSPDWPWWLDILQYQHWLDCPQSTRPLGWGRHVLCFTSCQHLHVATLNTLNTLNTPNTPNTPSQPSQTRQLSYITSQM